MKISVEGPGFATGSAAASSRAIAKITVTAIAEAFATATGSSVASSKARAEVSESDVAEAAASAVAKAESSGGTAISSQTVRAEYCELNLLLSSSIVLFLWVGNRELTGAF